MRLMLRILFTVWTVALWFTSIVYSIVIMGNSSLPAIISVLVIATWVVIGTWLFRITLLLIWPLLGRFMKDFWEAFV